MEVRNDFIRVRCNREEKQRFQDLARAEGCDVSTLIRRRVFVGAAEVPAPVPSLFDSPSASAGTRSALSGTTSGVGWPE